MKTILKKVGIAVLVVGITLNCGCVFRTLRPSVTSETMTIVDESQITTTMEPSVASTNQVPTITPTPYPTPESTPTETPTPETTFITPTKMPTQAITKAPTSAPTPTPTTAPEAWMEQKDTTATYQGAMNARNEGCTLIADTNVYSDKSQSSVLVVWPAGRQFVASTSPDNWIQVYITATETGAPVYGFISESAVTRHSPIPRNATLDTLAQARAEELALLGELNHNNMPNEANWEGVSGSSGGYTLYMHCGDNFEATSIGIGRATYHRADGSTYSVTCMLLKR